MAMDGLSLGLMTRELQPLLEGRVDRVQQPDKDSVLLYCHGPNCGRVRLLLHIHNELGRVQLVEEAPENPAAAPAFCMLLRKRLIGSRFVSIEQEGLDRILRITFSGRDEFMDESACTLVLELMGKHGNLYLLDKEGRILDCLRHIGLGSEASRLSLPNVLYEAPPRQDKQNPLTAPAEAFSGLSAPGQLMERFSGISRQAARLIWEAASRQTDPGVYLHAFFADLAQGGFCPCIVSGVGPMAFMPPAGEAAFSYPSLSAALTAYYKGQDLRMRMSRMTGELKTVLERAHSRTLHKLEGFRRELGSQELEAQYRLYGQLLTGYSGPVPRGASSLAVENYFVYPPEKTPVPLQPELSVKENAARYFKKYQKCKAGREYAAGQIAPLEQELAYLESQLLSLSLCESAREAEEIKTELVAQKYMRPPQGKRTPNPQSKSQPMEFVSSEGTPILVGKNNRQNEELTRTAPADALWLHAKDMAGSHVIVLSQGLPGEKTLSEAAALAAYFSKGRSSGKVPVDYVLRRYVKKPAGSPPGFVIFTNQRTLLAQPDGELARALRKN